MGTKTADLLVIEVAGLSAIGPSKAETSRPLVGLVELRSPARRLWPQPIRRTDGRSPKIERTERQLRLAVSA